MKSFIIPAYTFTPGASGVGTVNLSGIASFEVKRLVAIINQTRGEMVYATGSTLLKYTGVAGSVVTLFADTSSMNAGDDLQIIYEVEDSQNYGPLGILLLDFATNNVDNTAYVEISADIGIFMARKVQVFMSSGDLLYLAFGAAAAEVNKIVITPGGNGLIDLLIPANSRLSVKAVDAVTVSEGRLIINVLG